MEDIITLIVGSLILWAAYSDLKNSDKKTFINPLVVFLIFVSVFHIFKVLLVSTNVVELSTYYQMYAGFVLYKFCDLHCYNDMKTKELQREIDSIKKGEISNKEMNNKIDFLIREFDKKKSKK